MVSEFQTDIYGALDVLRRIDGEVDFARGSLQIAILLELGKAGEGLTTRDLARRLNERSKSIADALRKMTLKNIVTKVKNGSGDYEVYVLTDHGRKLYEDLIQIIKPNGYGISIPKRENRIPPHDFALELIKKDYIVDAIIAIATSKKGMVCVKEVSEAMGLSTQRAQTYLNMFSGKDAPIKLFKRLDSSIPVLDIGLYDEDSTNADNRNAIKQLLKLVKRLIGYRKRNNKVYYMLTEDGYAVFHKLPFYVKYTTSRSAKLLRRLFGSLHPRLVAKKLFKTVALINIVATIVSLMLSTMLPIASLAILILSIVVSTSMLVLYIATYNL